MSRWTLVLLGLHVWPSELQAQTDPIACNRQMRKTIEAVQAWRRLHHGEYPGRLADLKAAGLLPEDGAICPDLINELRGAAAAHRESTSRREEGDPPGTYEYEMSDRVSKWKADKMYLRDGTPPYTRQQLKAVLLRRPFWEQVPLLRCSSHREHAPSSIGARSEARRNATADGRVYWSGMNWEQIWLNDVPLCARDANVLFGFKGPPFHSGRTMTLDQALDIRSWACAFGDHPWWWTYPMFDEGPNKQPAAELSPFFEGNHGRVATVGATEWWIDGLVQLQGRILTNSKNKYREPGMLAFVWQRTGLKVERSFRQATWLQGTVWTAPPGDTAGWLVWHYADSAVERVPILYGQTTARFWGDARQIQGETDFPKPVWEHHETAEAVGRERWLRLYQQTWTNPRPNVKVTSLDFISHSNSPAAPFLIAVNVIP